MHKTTNLTELVKREISNFALLSPNATAYYVENDAQQVYAVISVPKQNTQKTSVMMMARVKGDKIIIESDKTDRPLYEELLRVGIPREQIVLAYAGEILSAT